MHFLYNNKVRLFPKLYKWKATDFIFIYDYMYAIYVHVNYILKKNYFNVPLLQNFSSL